MHTYCCLGNHNDNTHSALTNNHKRNNSTLYEPWDERKNITPQSPHTKNRTTGHSIMHFITDNVRSQVQINPDPIGFLLLLPTFNKYIINAVCFFTFNTCTLPRYQTSIYFVGLFTIELNDYSFC